MAALGFRTMDEMIGRVDRLDVKAGASTTGRRAGLDFSAHPLPAGMSARRRACAA